MSIGYGWQGKSSQPEKLLSCRNPYSSNCYFHRYRCRKVLSMSPVDYPRSSFFLVKRKIGREIFYATENPKRCRLRMWIFLTCGEWHKRNKNSETAKYFEPVGSWM